MERKQITRIVLIALFAALTAAGAFIKIPMVPVPVTLQTLFALLTAVALPPLMALLSMAAYLFIGAIGLPIFTTGGGLAAMLGPTGGFLIGMLPAVFAASLIMKAITSKLRIAAIAASLAATAIIYFIGVPWLSVKMDIPLSAALASGFLPFIPGDTLKIIIAVIIAPVIRPRVQQLLEQ